MKGARRREEPIEGASARLRASILSWYRKHRRDLPWRRTRDPYAIWVSEVMLQQTRVETVVPYYERFLRRFPDPRALASAKEADVLAAWSGLGYYGRAKNLRDAALLLVREHDGRIPDDDAALRRLPGIGDYTAAAIASVAFGRSAAAVDGNVVRVLARIYGLRGSRTAPALRASVRARAESLAPGPAPGDWTQALMELGATVCLPREPRCDVCPARGACAAGRSGVPDRYPEAAAKKAPERGRKVMLVARRAGRVLLVPDPDVGPGAVWTLPTALSKGRTASTASALARRLGQERPKGPVARFRHRTFSHDLEFEIWESEPRPGLALGSGRWVRPKEFKGIPMRSPTLKAFNKLRLTE